MRQNTSLSPKDMANTVKNNVAMLSTIPAEHYHARNRVLLYTKGIPLPPTESVALALEALQKADATPSCTSYMQHSMHTLQQLLTEKNIPFSITTQHGQKLQNTPPLNKSTMLPEGFEHNILQRIWQKICQKSKQNISSSDTHVSKAPQEPWEHTVALRRLMLIPLTLLPSLLAGLMLYSLLAETTWLPLLFISCALFTILFYWISLGFWSFMAGIAIILRKNDMYSLQHTVAEDSCLDENTRTALLFPIYNEDAHTVCAGIKTLYQSLCQEHIENSFDIYILSDSTKADAWIHEEEAWYNLCVTEKAHNRIFYRHRKMNLKRKSGNIADFCRRWGKQYSYMVVFDADSLMTAKSLKRMVQIMEHNPHVGIVQSPPKIIKSTSLLARTQQFANHLYGPVFAAGLNFWRLGNTQYWGHNAIIRIAPFMKHCQLPKLSGKAPLGGEILSHDFVESALMRRAGYGVWLAYDMEGSFEQTPPSLIDELIRDRRWCQGNLQHSRLLFARGFFPTHRALFINGIMSYVSALLWLLLLIASSALVIMELFIVPEYFPSEVSLLPNWPQYFPHWLLTLLSCTAALLFLPKILVIALMCVKGWSKAFGGCCKMSLSVLGEIIISTFLAPVRMLFHSAFVISSLLGRTVSWNPQNREDTGTSWSDALRFHWWGTVIGGVWGWFMYLANPEFFVWFSPVALGLMLSIPLSVLASKVSLGNYVHNLGLFLTPPDTQPCHELKNLEKNLHSPQYTPFDLPLHNKTKAGFIRATVIHAVLSLHMSLTRQRKHPSAACSVLIEKALNEGPEALSNAEKLLLLHNPQQLKILHHKIWSSHEQCAVRWGIKST